MKSVRDIAPRISFDTCEIFENDVGCIIADRVTAKVHDVVFQLREVIYRNYSR